ncbi:MAG: N-acetylmuramoyl-L-alanine amidase [Candidatus Omnitrophica bacterium]|nr:N-acetylmuramoyl-L-alanine amidase [Candidatus Omnitrophota bacterium]
MTPKDIKYIVVHCSACMISENHKYRDLKNLHTWPKTKEVKWGGRVIPCKGWTDIGYHAVIERSGPPLIGRPLNVMGAHVRGYNNKSIGICLIGGLGEDGQPESNYSPSQWTWLAKSIAMYKSIYPDAEVVGHNDLNPNKACPCFDVKQYVKRERL